jgi:hypothetical protein
MNITNTASNAASLLVDLQVGGSTIFSVSATTGATVLDGNATIVGEAANTLALRNGTNDQCFNVYNTYTSAVSYERGLLCWSNTTNVLTLGTQKGGGGATRNIEVLIGNTREMDYGISNAGWTITSPMGTNAPLNVKGNDTANNSTVFQALEPSLGTGNTMYLNYGVAPSTNNWTSFGFTYVGFGSASNAFSIAFYGTATMFAVTAGGAVMMPSIANANGTNPVCFNSTGGAISYATTACVASAERFKTLLEPATLNLDGMAFLRIDRPWLYRQDSGFYDGGKLHVGLIADDVERMDPRCVSYDKENKLDNYSRDCVLLYLVAARKADRTDFDSYRASHP